MSNGETHKIESVAVNLLWLRPGGVGGTEFFTRNLLDGFMNLKEEFKFVLVCTEHDAEFDKAVAEAGASGCVIKIGFVSNSEKVALYKHCDKHLFASIFEGFGMTPIEVM